MKIYQLISENFKRLTAVDITLDGKSLTITGKNGSGKTTLLEIIETTLAGSKRIPPEPIQRGKEKASNTVILQNDDGTKIICERRFTKDKQTLTVKTDKGGRYSSPQAFLDGLLGNISFDPFEFLAKKPMEQKKSYMDFCNLDFSDIDARKRGVLDDIDANRKLIISLDTELMTLPYHKEVIEREEKEASVLFGKITEANNLTNERNKIANEIGNAITNRTTLEDKLKGVNADIEFLISEQKRLTAKLTENESVIEQKTKELDSIIVPDVSDIQEAIRNIDSQNAKIRDNIRFDEKKEAREKATETAESLKKKLSEIEQEKVDMIKKANMPVPGLSFSDDGLLFEGLPFTESQISKSKIIEIGIRIGMALNPHLRIMRIKDGSLLDSETLETVKNLCKDKDYQLFIEKVTDDSELGFVIEESTEETN